MIRVFIFITIISVSCFSRVLNLSDEKFASFFSGEMGTSLLKTSPFDAQVVGTDTFSSEYTSSYGGEFGFVYSTPYIAWRFSFEILKPSKLTAVEASQSGTVNYLVASDVTAVAPKLGIELHLNRKPNARFYIFGFYGSSNLTMTNTYTQVLVSPNVDHEVSLKSSAPVTGGGLAYEFSFVDTTTICLELGYRSLVFKEIKFSKDTTTFQGAKVAGDAYQDYAGVDKTLNFSNYFAGISFRFWL